MTRTAIGFVCSLIVAAGALNADDPKPPRPKAEEPEEKQARTYRELFEKVGRSGLPALTESKDTGLTLQASWELHKKVVERAEVPGARKFVLAPKQTYDATEMKKFVAFLKERTKAPVPDWWEKGIQSLYVASEAKIHIYFGEEKPLSLLDKIEFKNKAWYVKKGAKLSVRDGMYSYRNGDVAIEYTRNGESHLLFSGDCVADVSAEQNACVATYPEVNGFPFRIAGFERKSGKRLWESDVWALKRRGHLGSSAEHRVELTTKGDTVFAFGAAFLGMYLEAFDLGTGKCQFRFCTSYWGHNSEEWNLKPND